MVSSTLVNVLGNGNRQFSIQDFMPRFDVQRRTPADVASTIKAWARACNEVVKGEGVKG